MAGLSPAGNAKETGAPRDIDCSVDLSRPAYPALAASPCRIANMASAARVETPHLA
jgi:hypothetical protein